MPSLPPSLGNGEQKMQQQQQPHARTARRQSIAQQRKALPIASVEKRIVDEVRMNHTLIIVGETGSGKTTQLPQFLFNAGFCRDGKVIGITQPRRVAAVTIAKRVAEECNTELGQRVGYSVRFDDATSSSTRVKYMTDGLLLREALLDPLLSKYSIIIIDEAHERTVHTDVLLGLLKNVQCARSQSAVRQHSLDKPDANKCVLSNKEYNLQSQGAQLTSLKLVIMSASLDARGFSEYFGGAKAVHIEGRQYPVDILYTYQPEPDYLDAALITIFQIHLEEEGPGDILAFLTGQEEIESIERLIQERLRQLPVGSQKLIVVPIYSSLPSEQQMNVFKLAPSGFRKMELLGKLDFMSLSVSGENYISWTRDVKIHLTSKKLSMAIVKDNVLSNAHRAEAMILIRKHLDEVLRLDYSSIEDPQKLWDELTSCFDHQKTILLPEARNRWDTLRFLDFKTEQYRAKNYTRFSELIIVLLLAEKNNDLLLKNNQARPVGIRPMPEAHAVKHGHRGRGTGPGPSRKRGGRGSKAKFAPYNRPYNGPPQHRERQERRNAPRGGHHSGRRGGNRGGYRGRTTQNRPLNQNQRKDTSHGHAVQRTFLLKVDTAPAKTNIVKTAQFSDLGTPDLITAWSVAGVALSCP